MNPAFESDHDLGWSFFYILNDMGSPTEIRSAATILGGRNKRGGGRPEMREGKLTGRKHSPSEEQAHVLNG